VNRGHGRCQKPRSLTVTEARDSSRPHPVETYSSQGKKVVDSLTLAVTRGPRGAALALQAS
jgi:hypothetical protein